VVELLDEQGAQLRVKILRLGSKVIQAAAQLESDHRKAGFFANRCGLHQLVKNGSETALRGLRRPVEHDPGREITRVEPCRVGAALARLVERAADLHLHDLEPRREQPLRRLVGLKCCLQVSGEAGADLEPPSHQGLELRQIGSQRGDQQLDRDRRLAGAAGASDVGQPDDEAVDLRPHPARYLVALLRGRGGEQGGSRGDEPIGRARDRHRADDLRHAGIDQFEPVSDLAESIDTGGGGKNGEGADPEEGEQQPPADAEIPAPEFRTVRLSAFQCRRGQPAPRSFFPGP
jgi:hypothetical protein